MGTYVIRVSVVDNNSVGDAVNGVLSHVDTFVITITPLNHPCAIDTSTTVLSGYYFLMDETDKKIPLPPATMYGDPDLLDSHTWSFASSGGKDMNYWVTVDGTVDYAEFELTSSDRSDKISSPIPHTIVATLYDDDYYGSTIVESCYIEYFVEIYPRFYLKSEMDPLVMTTYEETAVYSCPSYEHDDPDDELEYDYKLMDGSDLPDFITTNGRKLTMVPLTNDDAGNYNIAVTLKSFRYLTYYEEHKAIFSLTVLPFDFAALAAAEAEAAAAAAAAAEEAAEEAAEAEAEANGETIDEDYVEDTEEAVAAAISEAVLVNPEYSLEDDEVPVDGEIVKATTTGKVYVEFSKRMQKIGNLRLFNMAYGKGRRLEEEEDGENNNEEVFEGEILQRILFKGGGALKLKYLTDNDENRDGITNWNVTEQTATRMTLDINYTSPELVSMG